LAKIQGKSTKVEDIIVHGEKDWRALAWLLARQFPEEYGRQGRGIHHSTPEGPLRSTLDLTGVPVEKLDQAIAAIDILIEQAEREIEIVG